MKRIQWVDVAKGMGITLVVLAHSRFCSTGYIGHWITAFHMPLFFVLAGLCYDAKRYPNLISYGKRKCVALVYPFVTLSLIATAVSAALNFGDTFRPLEMLHKLVHYPFINVAPLWFVEVLLLTELMYALLVRVIQREWLQLLASVMFLLMGFVIHGHGIWPLDVAFVATFFYSFGYVLRPFVSRLTFPLVCVAAPALMVAYSAVVWFVRYDHSMAILDISNKVAFPGVAILGTLAVILAAMLIDQLPRQLKWVSGGLAYLGRNSIILLVIHPIAGICRSSWVSRGMAGPLSQVLELMLIAAVLFFLSGPAAFLVRPRVKKDR